MAEAVAAGLDPSTLAVGEIMTPDLATLQESAGVFEAIRYMRDKGVRSMPVVEGGWRLGRDSGAR